MYTNISSNFIWFRDDVGHTRGPSWIWSQRVKWEQRRPALLSNKERMLLRKQALKMKKRPVLAVGNLQVLTLKVEI